MAYGARYVGTTDGKSNAITKEFIVQNGVTVTKGDFVRLGSGVLTSASQAANRILGVAKETVVGDGTLTCQVITEPNALYLVDNDNDTTTFASTHVGTFFAVTGGTGAQQIDTDTTHATAGPLVCLEYNPQIDPYKADISIGLFQIAEHALQSTDA
jgi:hypothetical protein